MHNGLITSLSLHPLKYFNEFIMRYGFLDTNILLASLPSILVSFLFL